MLPSALSLGAQKAGTTSLFTYLTQHPLVGRPTRKEIGYFDINFDRGLSWYRAHFPIRRPNTLTLEASTGYLDYLHAPERVARVLPAVRLIVLLRDPVDRAWSHYRHTVRLSHEALAFEDAIAQEGSRTNWIYERMEHDEAFYSRDRDYYSYLRRGRYVEQLERWLAVFPREQLLVLWTEDLEKNPGDVVKQAFSFLDLPAYEGVRYERLNSDTEPGVKMRLETHQRLQEYFQPYNVRLAELLGCDVRW